MRYIENKVEREQVQEMFGLPLLCLSKYAIIEIANIIDRVRMFPKFSSPESTLENITNFFPGSFCCCKLI